MPENRRQNTRLLDAVKVDNDVAAARRALKSGADVDTMGGMDRSMLYYAASHGNEEMVDLLLSFKPKKINQTDEEGFTPLHEALAKGHLDIAQKLLDAGADINAHDPHSTLGLTPLHVAFNADMREERVDRVLFALHAGADETKTDLPGRTAMDVARERMHKWPFAGEMLTLMLEFLKDRAEQAQNAIQAQKDAENAVVDQAVHGGLQNSMTVRRIQLKFGPKR
jgi:hypothetical protein